MKYIYSLIIPFLVMSQLSSFIEDLWIFPQSSETKMLGYNNCNMYTNGESFILEHLLEPNMIVFDVGASAGEWSRMVLHHEPSINVYAFEPIPHIFQILQRQLQSYIQCFNCALSDRTGTKEFYYYDKNQAQSRLSTFYRRNEQIEQQLNLEPTVISVEIESLDTFCTNHKIDHIDYLKIDTEGAEVEILHGTEEMITQHRIKYIQFEYGGCFADADTTLHKVYNLLSEYEYMLFRIIPQGLIAIVEWNDELENYQYSNYLGVSAKS